MERSEIRGNLSHSEKIAVRRASRRADWETQTRRRKGDQKLASQFNPIVEFPAWQGDAGWEMARRKNRARNAITAANAEREFERELEVFRTEAEGAAQFFYSWLAVHAAAGDEKAVHRLLNTAPLFWNTTLGALQSATFVTLGRIFDFDSTHNLSRLLRIAQDYPSLFSKAALGRRKQEASAAPPSWLPAIRPRRYSVRQMRKKPSPHADSASVHERILQEAGRFLTDASRALPPTGGRA